MGYNTNLQNKNLKLRELLDKVETLPSDRPDGVDTSDATATAGDILINKTAYVNGQKIEGTIESQPAKTITPSSNDQIAVESGMYTEGTVTVLGDANLSAENIAEGISIFGIVGTHENGIDTSDATAAANEIFNGKTAYVDKEKVTGTFTITQEITEQEQLLTELENILINKGAINCTLYVGSTTPTDDIGVDGDIYIVRGHNI